VVISPADGEIAYKDKKMLINGAIVDYAKEKKSAQRN
jgi:hypothetical protein